MSVPTSNVAVLNLAFDLLKAASATSITAPTSLVEAIGARWYDVTRKARLRTFASSFARKRDTVSRNSTAPLGDAYADAYDLPNDCVHVLFIGDNYGSNMPDYTVEGRQILTNNGGEASMIIGYIKDAVNVNEFDPLFTLVLAYDLAVRMALPVTGKQSVKNTLKTERAELISEMRTANGQENPVKVIRKSEFTNERFRSGAGYYSSDVIIEAP